MSSPFIFGPRPLLHANNKIIKCYKRVINNMNNIMRQPACLILLDFSLTVKVTTLIFISGGGSAISSSKYGKSGFVYNLVKS